MYLILITGIFLWNISESYLQKDTVVLCQYQTNEKENELYKSDIKINDKFMPEFFICMAAVNRYVFFSIQNVLQTSNHLRKPAV